MWWNNLSNNVTQLVALIYILLADTHVYMHEIAIKPLTNHVNVYM